MKTEMQVSSRNHPDNMEEGDPMSNGPTIYVVDDDPQMLQALGRTIGSSGWETEFFHSGQDFLDVFEPEKPGCIVLDVRLPTMGGLTIQDTLIRSGTRTPIIFITGYGDVPTAVRAIQSGAFAFIEKPFSEQQLLDLIERAVKQDEATRKHQELVAEVESCVSNLTKRERDVMEQIVKGNINKEIADILGIHVRTVEHHRSNLLKKMRSRTAIDLMKKLEYIKDQEK